MGIYTQSIGTPAKLESDRQSYRQCAQGQHCLPTRCFYFRRLDHREATARRYVVPHRTADYQKNIQTCPREYNLEVSIDGSTWTKIIDKGAGTGSSTTIRFDPIEARYIRLTLTQSASIVKGERRGQPFDYITPWTMREFKIFAL